MTSVLVKPEHTQKAFKQMDECCKVNMPQELTLSISNVPRRGGERKRRLVVYVAGPYRDKRGLYYVDRNINDAREVAAKLWSWSFSVVCPHTNTRFLDGYEGIQDDAFLNGDLDQIERVDLLVAIPRWQTSSGTLGEIAHAKKCDIDVFYWEDPEQRSKLEKLGKTWFSLQSDEYTVTSAGDQTKEQPR